MLRIRRTDEREVIGYDGRAFTLVSRTWTVHLTAPGLGLGYWYRRPLAVEGPSLTVNIRDHLMLARIAALALLAASALIRRRGL